ncbi:MAG TPA: ATP-binding protein [Candidatus Limnocylindrales bacterium]|nr:ATP-binding protein [Candidatus Limnocylindrales bacterium]
MTSTGPGSSPLAVAALALVQRGATAADLERRFSENGAELQPGVGEGLLAELESLGLVRISRGSPAREYVLSSLGRRLVRQGTWTEAAVPMKDLERMRTDFLSVIAHELRTPITVMRTLTGLLLDPASDPSPEQRRTMLETMERNAERMQHLIGEILDLARYRAGTIGLQLRPFDAAELAESAVATIRPLAERRNQTVELKVPRGPSPRVFGDRPRLDRALLNLVSNAQHFAPDGGHIIVRLHRPADGMIRWSVTDDGPGIAPEDQAHLFERFYVGARDPSEAQEGVGLGLPRALAIAQAHGGTIDVRSRPGHGSTFTLAVPAAGPPDDAG